VSLSAGEAAESDAARRHDAPEGRRIVIECHHFPTARDGAGQSRPSLAASLGFVKKRESLNIS